MRVILLRVKVQESGGNQVDSWMQLSHKFIESEVNYGGVIWKVRLMEDLESGN
jgi:hypothetical protein